MGLVIKDLNDVELIGVNNRHYHTNKINQQDVFVGKVSIQINEFKLLPGVYKIDLYLGDSITDIEIKKDAIQFTVSESFEYEVLNSLNFKINKVFHETINWNYECLDI